MNRIVLVSDATKEFPKNTTSSFKVRLPVPFELKGEGWKVGLAAISTPDAALDLARLTNAVNPRVFRVGAKLVNSLKADDIPYHLETVINIDVAAWISRSVPKPPGYDLTRYVASRMHIKRRRHRR